MSRIDVGRDVVPDQPVTTGRGASWSATVPGLLLAVVIAAAATGIGAAVPVVGAPVIGIVIGVITAMVVKPGQRLRPGIGVASKFVLQLSVVILGSQLSLRQVWHVGVSSLPVMLGTLAVCLAAAYWVGRWLGILGSVRTLVGVGTGICGASAIAAVTPVIGAEGLEVAYAVSTIFLFNVAAVLVFPIAGHLLGLTPHSFGLFAGTAVNDMSSVVAASTSYGGSAANYAVVVKLTRTLLIVPICLGLAAYTGRHRADAPTTVERTDVVHRSAPSIRRLVPWFLVGFLVVVGVNSAGVIPVGARHGLAVLSGFLITVALSGVGLSTDLAGFRSSGVRPVLLGGVLWIVVATSSLGLQYLMGGLR